MSVTTGTGDTLSGYLGPRRRTTIPKRRVSVSGIQRRWRSKTVVAVVGLGSACRRLVWQCLQQSSAGIEVAGVFGDAADDGASGYCLGTAVGGGICDLLELARSRQIDAVILAIPEAAEHRISRAISQLRHIAVDIYLQVDRPTAGDESPLCALPVKLIERRPLSPRAMAIKAIEDRVLAGVILLLISPLLLGIALLVKLDSPGPVIFRQKRYGLNNALIEIFKFRTLYVAQSDGNADQLVTRNDRRVTRIGAFLRRTSLDELPQFINVLLGDMSVVGPRPHALAAKAGPLQYDEIVMNYGARHRVKPGITGWAQINGWRGETSTEEQIEQRVAHDFFYIANWSLLFDLRIVARTVLGGFGGRQAY